MNNNKKIVYLVRQTQNSDGYDLRTIAVYENKQDAINLARELNKTYGHACVFDENWDLVEFDMSDDPHFYDVESQELNPNPNDYTWSA